MSLDSYLFPISQSIIQCPCRRVRFTKYSSLIEDAGAVICWDFDVMKNDVEFSVLRTKVPITHPKEPHSPTGALGVIDAVIGGDDVHKSVIEKGWKEGVDYFRVEPQLVCHDGESVQGSHVTSNMGTHILQWKYYEAPHSMQHNSALDLIDSITSHKAKVMYCYETLRSADYKGSMTSLQSCQSGFSHLSSTTGKSSLNSSCPSR
ncbi:SEC14-like protein 1 [Armadillidium vulgare]|nr:SEC14-like protein 1 [Armadillidium vulgare]